jgi:hypothetical protein
MKKLLAYTLELVEKLIVQEVNMMANKKVVPEAKQALSQMKYEIASELGLSNYQTTDKGNLTARQNGYVGGYMTKRLVEMAERQMSGK